MSVGGKLTRRVIAGVVAADLIALAAFSIHLDKTTTITTRTAATVPTITTPSTVPAIAATALTGTVPIGTSTAIGSAPVVVSNGSSVRPPSHVTTPPTSGGPIPTSSSIPACPIHLTSADASGGLQSLIPFAPAFGPWSAEAFALAAVYQPELQLLGPVLAQYPQLKPVIGPQATTFVNALGTLTTLGFNALSPLYAPYRAQVLQQETALAAKLAPYSRSLVDTPLGGCVVELENALVAGGKGLKPAQPAGTSASHRSE